MERIKDFFSSNFLQAVNIVLAFSLVFIISGNFYFNADAYPSNAYWLTTALLPVILLILNDINQVFSGAGRRFPLLVVIFSNMIALFFAFFLANSATTGYINMLALSKQCLMSFGASIVISLSFYSVYKIAKSLITSRSIGVQQEQE